MRERNGELHGRFAADGWLAVWLAGVDEDGILVFAGGSSSNRKGRWDARLHLDGGGGGGDLLGPAVSADGILVFAGGSSLNRKGRWGRWDARLHLHGGGGGGDLLGPAVSAETVKSGSHARLRPKTSGRQNSRVGEGQWLLLGFWARNAIWALRDIL
jgi:hypothetical protein